MSQKNPFIYILGSVILIFVAACAPTATVPTQQQPISTSNPSVFSTAVAGTAAAFLTQTMEAMPTPTVTLPAPTETPTPIPTSTPTVTATSTDVDVNEKTSLSEMEDNSTQFFDYQAGVKLTIPVDWLAVRLSEQEYLDAKNEAVEDSVLMHGLEAIQDLDPVIYRLHAFNTQEGYVHEGQGSHIAVLFIEGDTQELELIAEVEVQPKDFEGYKFLSFEYQEIADSLEIFALEETWEVISSTELQVDVYHKRVVFKVSTGTVYIDLQVPSELSNAILAEVDTMVEQLSVFVP